METDVRMLRSSSIRAIVGIDASGGFHARGGPAAARRQGLRAQFLQDRTGAPRHRSRTDAGRARHAAVAGQQEDSVSSGLKAGPGGSIRATRNEKPMTYIGTPASRIDGRAKVTGAAKYAGE